MMEEKTKDYKARDTRGDALRFIGLICIILAHTFPPLSIYQLRNFDVPLLVMVSGFVYSLTVKEDITYLSYIKNRAQRLVLPMWMFLIIFFSAGYVVYSLIGQPFPFTTTSIITSFTLDSGIGFVWIIKVFLLTALVCPFYYQLSKLLSTRNYLLWIVGLYIFYESVVFTTININSVVIRYILDNYLYYIFPYGLVAAVGIILPRLQKKTILALALSFGVVFIGQTIYYSEKAGHFVQTQLYKSPPQLYYLSYALFISLLLYLLIENKSLQRVMNNNFVRFTSSSTMWIYLWHIAFIFIAQMFTFLQKPFYFYFIYLFTTALILVYLQKKVIDYFVNKYSLKREIRQALNVLFLK